MAKTKTTNPKARPKAKAKSRAKPKARDTQHLDGLTDEQKKLAKPLTNLQILTVIHIVGGMNATRAYFEAGGKAKTEEAARAIVSRMLTNANVDKFRQSMLKPIVKDSIMSREEALERLTRIARTEIHDIAEFAEIEVEAAGGKKLKKTIWRIKNSDEIPAGALGSIKSVTATKMGPKLELHDSLAATKQLAELQGWEAPKQSHLTFPLGVPVKKFTPEDYKRAAEEMCGHFDD